MMSLGTANHLDSGPTTTARQRRVRHHHHRHAYSLAACAGQAITLKLTEAEDAELQMSFVIDDTSLTVS
jgi:hypothetical protein